MSNKHKRLNYTVLVPYPVGGGHWAAVGDKSDLLDVEAHALRAAGRIELTSLVEVAANTAAVNSKATIKKGAE